MKKVILIYTSMTGNTETLAAAVRSGVEQAGAKLTVKEAYDAYPDDLLDYDGILIGTYTWDGGEIPDEFMDFYEELDNLNLSDKKAAIFGSGDSFYTYTFGAALKQFAEKMQDLGADVCLPTLLIDLYPEQSEIDKCKEFGIQFVNKLKE